MAWPVSSMVSCCFRASSKFFAWCYRTNPFHRSQCLLSPMPDDDQQRFLVGCSCQTRLLQWLLPLVLLPRQQVAKTELLLPSAKARKIYVLTAPVNTKKAGLCILTPTSSGVGKLNYRWKKVWSNENAKVSKVSWTEAKTVWLVRD